MDLKHIHLLFITLATLMCLGCSLIFFGNYRATGAGPWLWTGLLMLLATVGLPVYGFFFIKKLQRNGIKL